MADLLEIASIKKTKADPVYNTETMLPFSEIQQDTIILKDGGLRAVVKVGGVNIDLKNGADVDVVVEQYRRFINALDFPLQILIRNTYLDLSEYLHYMHTNVSTIDNPVLKGQGEKYMQFLENINLQQGLVYTKEFYVVIPYYSASSDRAKVQKPRYVKLLDALSNKDSAEKIVSRYRTFLANKKFLDTRVSLVTDGLQAMGLRTQRLQLHELTDVLFKVYNPQADTSQAPMDEE